MGEVSDPKIVQGLSFFSGTNNFSIRRTQLDKDTFKECRDKVARAMQACLAMADRRSLRTYKLSWY